uniref:Uncharacterized protein n=1 Tax=Romanomermis culicivorax TaxID=13658 RepID=A0A915I9A6_ROMCU
MIKGLGYKRMAKEQYCGCDIFTTAAVIGVCQFILIVLALATSGVLLNNWSNWKQDWKSKDQMMDITVNDAATTTTKSTTIFNADFSSISSMSSKFPQHKKHHHFGRLKLDDAGLDAFIEIHLAHHVSIYSTWLLFMLLYAWAFRAMRPILVLPNFIMQIIALIAIIVLSGTLIAKLTELNHVTNDQNQKREQSFMDKADKRYAYYAVLLSCLIVVGVLELIFAFVGYRFYRYLHDQISNLYPDLPVITMPDMSYVGRVMTPRIFQTSAPHHHNDPTVMNTTA